MKKTSSSREDVPIDEDIHSVKMSEKTLDL